MTERQQILGCILWDVSILGDLKLPIRFFTTPIDQDIYKLLKKGITTDPEIHKNLHTKYENISTYIGNLMKGIAPARAKEWALQLVKKIKKTDLFQTIHDEGKSVLKTGSVDEEKVDEFAVKWLRMRRTDSPVGDVTSDLSEIESLPVDWLWINYIPLGRLTMLSGDPGEGKTFVALDLASRVSKGGRWPDGTEIEKPGRVFYISIEDKASDTIRPRVDSLGGDPTKIKVLHPENETYLNFSDESGLSILKDVVEKIKDLRLVVIDPILDFSGKTNPNAAEQVRKLLSPLSKLAEIHNFALVLIAHLNKDQAKSAMYRTGGATSAWLGKCRAGFMIFRNMEDKTQRFFTPLKSNLSKISPGDWSFRISDGSIIWERCEEEVDVDIHINPERRVEAKETNHSVLWLREKLKDGPVESKALKIMASEDGISSSALWRASAKIKVIKNMSGFGTRSSDWSIPEND